MPKKVLVLLVIIAFVFSFFPTIGLALPATHVVGDGESLNLTTGVLTKEDSSTVNYSISDGDTISVTAGATAGITGSKQIIIRCGSGVNLTLDGVVIDRSSSYGAAALTFLGGTNTLTLVGDSTLKSGDSKAGIVVNQYIDLTILGSGKVCAYGGLDGAGIGGEMSFGGGDITIQGDAAVEAYGGNNAAGIGGGLAERGGTVVIKDNADVKAIGGDKGAGIGGGKAGHGGDISISGSAVVNVTGGAGAAGIGGGENNHAISVEISGAANVIAVGTDGGAGIGGGYLGSGGEITIEGGVVEAQGGEDGAGIGGGEVGSGGIVDITGGTVTATGGGGGAGIGGGYQSNGGSVEITGGTVNATGGYTGGAGIGGGAGLGGYGGSVKITGGTVNATGGEYGAGIGGGNCGTGGDNVIMGGIVIAQGDVDADDIGAGKFDSGGTLAISGDSGVFLKKDQCGTPTTTLTHFDLTPIVDGKLYGVELPDTWTECGGYIVLKTLSYNANGAAGTVPESATQQYSTTITAAAKGDLTNGRLVMIHWNTKADGNGTAYVPGSDYVFTEDTTLYAIWRDSDVVSVTIDKTSISLLEGGSETLTATVTPEGATKNDVVWYSSNPDVATVDQGGDVTAVSSGYAIITAWADGMSDTCTVTVRAKDEVYLRLSSSSEDLLLGGEVALSATVGPAYAANSTVSWTSTNESAAMVDDNGKVTAVSEGATAIIAEARGAYDVCVVVVTVEEEEVVIAQVMESEPADSEPEPEPEAINGADTNGEATDGADEVVKLNGEKKDVPSFTWGYILIAILGAALLGAGVWIYMLFRKYR